MDTSPSPHSDSPRQLVAFRVDEPAIAMRVRRRLAERAPSETDATFGVQEIDPGAGWFAVLVTGDAQLICDALKADADVREVEVHDDRGIEPTED